MTPTPYGYKAKWGYYTDIETGILLLTHRYFDPATGRFLTRDPVGVEGGINLYAYVGNAVVNKIDPWGASPDDIRKSCKGLNPNSYRCLAQAFAEPCEQCCNALAAGVPGYIGTVLGAGAPGPVTIPDARVQDCQISCEKACRRYPSGSLAIRNFLECLLKGTAYDYAIGYILDRLLNFLRYK